MKAAEQVIGLTVVLTAHAEGVLLHKSLKSVERALEPLDDAGVGAEVIIHCDTATIETEDYLRRNSLSERTSIYRNNFGDAAASRNFAVTLARGKYVAFVDADDLVSREWFLRAIAYLEAHPYGMYVAHSEFGVEFEGANCLVINRGETDQSTDTLLSVLDNRWNAIIVAARSTLIEIPFVPTGDGYGYEDWYLSCRLIHHGIHNVLIPGTAVFIRRKLANSRLLAQRTSAAVLPANSLLAFENIRALPTPKGSLARPSSLFRGRRLRRLVRLAGRVFKVSLAEATDPFPRADRVVRRVHRKLWFALSSAPDQVPGWLRQEWSDIHQIERKLYPLDEWPPLKVYESVTPLHYETGLAYKRMIDLTTRDRYDYILFVPWLVPGGADLEAITFANTVKELTPSKNVLVVATTPTDSPWADRLQGVDFVPMGQIAAGITPDARLRLFEQFVENSGAAVLHILNSAEAFDFAASHKLYLTASKKRLIVTGFCPVIEETGRETGYAHSHIPKVYDVADVITADNRALLQQWVDEYGFDENKLAVLYEPIEIPSQEAPARPLRTGALRVLWASRLCSQKLPHLVPAIGRLLRDVPITIDMYGLPDAGFRTPFLSAMPGNTQYRGPFDGFFQLPLEKYDLYLYTSLFDGTPNVLLEAAAAELPIVSSNIGGVPEFIEDGVSGLLVDDVRNPVAYAAALRRVLEHPDSLEAYAASLKRTLVETHSRSEYRTQVKKLLDRIGY